MFDGSLLDSQDPALAYCRQLHHINDDQRAALSQVRRGPRLTQYAQPSLSFSRRKGRSNRSLHFPLVFLLCLDLFQNTQYHHLFGLA